MSFLYVAVEGMTQIFAEVTAPDAGTVIATITIIGSPSEKGLVLGNKIYKDNLEIQVSNITYPFDGGGGATVPDPNPLPYTANYIAIAEKTKLENSLVLREGDLTGIISAIPQIPGSPNVNYPITFKVQIDNAGQVKVRSN